jgi:hypothetical protein
MWPTSIGSIDLRQQAVDFFASHLLADVDTDSLAGDNGWVHDGKPHFVVPFSTEFLKRACQGQRAMKGIVTAGKDMAVILAGVVCWFDEGDDAKRMIVLSVLREKAPFNAGGVFWPPFTP